MKKRVFTAWLLVFAMILLASCAGRSGGSAPGQGTKKDSAGSSTDPISPAGAAETSLVSVSALAGTSASSSGPEETSAVSSSGPAETSAVSAPAQPTPLGTWYEQTEFGGVLKISETKIRYIAYENRYTDEVDLKIVKKGTEYLLETDENDFFTFVDMTYDSSEDIVLVHDWPHTDGDGGYHLIEFRRTVYTPPPPPVYDPPVDNSDPDAPTAFEDLTIRSMKVSFYDPGPYHDPDSSMAMQPPYADNYSYDLKVLGDGNALVSSSFCQEIELPKETVDRLQELIDQSDLGAINGLDIHTPGLPPEAADYTLELELASGETIRSSANGDNVPENWRSFQEPMHYLLFFAFVDAGYQFNTGAFHSTKPMKRLGSPASDHPLKVDYDSVLIIPDWKKSYPYDLDTKYMIFRGTDPDRPALLKALQELSDLYKEKAEAALEEDYRMMEAVPRSVWRKADRLYCYSFFVVDQGKDHGSFYCFLMSEGHANSLGVGKNGYGNYPYVRYNLDTESGKILSLSDLFVSPDAACEVITSALREQYSTYNETGRFIHSDRFPDELMKYISRPAPEGISFNAAYHNMDLVFPKKLFPMAGNYNLTMSLYYDELQDVLSDAYTGIW